MTREAGRSTSTRAGATRSWASSGCKRPTSPGSPATDRGITVPAIVDIPTGQVVTNDYAQITLDLSTEWRAYHRPGAPDLYPVDRRAEIDEVARLVFRDVNNGVYRCGFTGTQEAYEKAYRRLFGRLDWLSARLQGQRYLIGDTITEADIRLFTTLVRFDAVYHGHFKCNRHKLTEMPVLWAYARDLFQTPGFGDTIDFDHIKRHYYQVHRDINPTGIVPAGPDLSGWLSPHGREALGGRPFGDGTPPDRRHPARPSPARTRRSLPEPQHRRHHRTGPGWRPSRDKPKGLMPAARFSTAAAQCTQGLASWGAERPFGCGARPRSQRCAPAGVRSPRRSSAPAA